MDRIKILYQLLKIQDYELIVRESEIVHNKKTGYDSIKEKINALREQIDNDILKIYNVKGVNRELNGCCNGCHMNISKGELSRLIKNQDKLPFCPSCHSLLFLQSFSR